MIQHQLTNDQIENIVLHFGNTGLLHGISDSIEVTDRVMNCILPLGTYQLLIFCRVTKRGS